MSSAARSFPASPEPGHAVVLEGFFDAVEANALAPVLDARPEGAITLDFSRCTEIRDRGLAVLARLLEDGERPVALRGLRAHQRRLLRYLGLEAA